MKLLYHISTISLLFAARLSSIAAKDVNVTIPVAGSNRDALIHLPPQTGTKKSLPLVINLHALLSSNVLQQKYSGFDEIADKEGFIVAYPQGISEGNAPTSWSTNRLAAKFLADLRGVIGTGLEKFTMSEGFSWNAGGCCGTASEARPPIDEIAFFRLLIEYIQNDIQKDERLSAAEKDFELDMERIYVTGMSNGGFMTNRVACEMADIIAAVAPVAGPMMDNRYKPTPNGFQIDEMFECKPSRPMPLLHIHSVHDRVVPFDEPRESPFNPLGLPSIPNESIDFWRKQNGVKNEASSVITEQGPRLSFPFGQKYQTTCTKYDIPEDGRDKENTAVVELCQHDSQVVTGHCWPSKGKTNFLNFVRASDVFRGTCLNGLGNQYIWDFFKQHKLSGSTTTTPTDVREEM